MRIALNLFIAASVATAWPAHSALAQSAQQDSVVMAVVRELRAGRGGMANDMFLDTSQRVSPATRSAIRDTLVAMAIAMPGGILPRDGYDPYWTARLYGRLLGRNANRPGSERADAAALLEIAMRAPFGTASFVAVNEIMGLKDRGLAVAFLVQIATSRSESAWYAVETLDGEELAPAGRNTLRDLVARNELTDSRAQQSAVRIAHWRKWR